VDFGVTPPTEVDRDLVGEGLPVDTVREVVFLQEWALVVVSEAFFLEATANALAVAVP